MIEFKLACLKCGYYDSSQKTLYRCHIRKTCPAFLKEAIRGTVEYFKDRNNDYLR